MKYSALLAVAFLGLAGTNASAQYIVPQYSTSYYVAPVSYYYSVPAKRYYVAPYTTYYTAAPVVAPVYTNYYVAPATVYYRTPVVTSYYYPRYYYYRPYGW